MRFRNILLPVALVGLTLFCGLSSQSLGAEEASADGRTDKVPEGLTIGDVESQLEKLKSSSLDDSGKDSAKGKFSGVIKILKDSTSFADSATYFRNSVDEAPKEAARIRQEVESMATPEHAAAIDRGLDVESLRKEVEEARAGLSRLGTQLEEAQKGLVRVRGRPVEIGERLPKARTELTDAEAGLNGFTPEASDSFSKVAERMNAEATAQKLAAEVEMLSQEQLSQAVRESLRLVRRDQLQRQRDNMQSRYAALSERLKQQMVVVTEELGSRLKGLASMTGPGGDEWDVRLEELRSLVGELISSGEQLAAISYKHRNLEEKRDATWLDYQRIKEQAKLGAIDGGFSQLLMRELRRLPNPRPIAGQIESHESEVRQFMLSGYQIGEKQREQRKLSDREKGIEAWQEMLAIREELLGKLAKNYGELVREAARFETDERSYRDLIVEFQKFLSAKLFWQRSSPLFGAEVLKDIPAAVAWSFDGAKWVEFGEVVRSIPNRHRLSTSILAVIVSILLILRRRLIRSIEKSGKRIHKISTDRYVHTLRALLESILLALPLPLIVGCIGMGALSHPSDSDWIRGFGQGLLWVALFLLWALGIREICRAGGLADVHLNWGSRACSVIRRSVVWLCLTYTPLSLIVSMMLFEESAKHFDSAGRIAFVLGHLSVVMVFAFLFNPSKGVFAEALEQDSGRVARRMRWFWYPLLVGMPIILVLLAICGFLWTALVLSLEFQATLRILITGVVVYGLLVRWFTIRQRRIALAEAIEERKAKRAEALKQKEAVEDDMPDFLEVSEEELNLDDVVAQTRRLLKVVVAIATVIFIWTLWAKTLPLDKETEVAITGEGLTWFSVIQLALLVPIAVVIVRNLPGLMDLAGLRSSKLDTGSRYALTTLCQYVVTAVALGMIFKLLDLDWAQFGWIAAALSVGLGFGLQEVVANFVCGIIILFERPIRIGDVVSLGEVTGTISRIRMRATTITDWDRKDFIVPNKEFITGSLMNWTLSSPINRLVIPVGVAYGTDTKAAREILLEIAEANPTVMDDPKSIATFEEFADSSLNLTLRCYLPNMDNRLRTRTELCEAMDARFKEAGIEIAFPQQDLHLRSVESSILEEKRAGSGAAG